LRGSPVDLFLAVCQGLGLALAAGVGGLLATLLMSVLAHVDFGWDLDGTDLDWFAAEWFVGALFALNVLAFLVTRGSPPRGAVRTATIAVVAALGAIAFAASLAEETSTWWPGIVIGIAVATAAGTVTESVLAGASARSEETAGTLTLIVAGTGMLLVVGSLLVPPVALLAGAGLAVLATGRRRRAEQKYEGLRSLR
jgi:hypothetical protein